MLNSIRHVGAKVAGASALVCLSMIALTPAAQAAEDLTLKFGPFRRTISIASLREFTTNGRATGNLASLLKVVKSEQRQSLTGLLQTQLPYDVVAADRLLRSPIGGQVLKQVAQATILPGGGDTEILALRSAIIGAAAQDKNVQFLTVLEKYPTPNLTVDIAALSKILSNPAFRSFLRP